jgi:hypothetical protein
MRMQEGERPAETKKESPPSSYFVRPSSSPFSMSWFGGGGGGGFDPDHDVASLRQQLALEREGKEKLVKIMARASGGTVLSDLQHQLNVEKEERARAATLLAGKEGVKRVYAHTSTDVPSSSSPTNNIINIFQHRLDEGYKNILTRSSSLPLRLTRSRVVVR